MRTVADLNLADVAIVAEVCEVNDLDGDPHSFKQGDEITVLGRETGIWKVRRTGNAPVADTDPFELSHDEAQKIKIQ